MQSIINKISAKKKRRKKMSYQSTIEWTNSTWNPVTGCTPISEGCRNCFAKDFVKMLQKKNNPKYRNGFNVTCHYPNLKDPGRWTDPRKVFVCSMSDLFHDHVPEDFILQVYEQMNRVDRHEYIVLTKRPERLAELNDRLPWKENIWAGVTVENQDSLGRIDELRKTDAQIKFISAEPLLEPLPDLDLTDIDWLIVGGETGSNARPMEKKWTFDLMSQCQQANIPVFFKHWGGGAKDKGGRLVHGSLHEQWPQKYFSRMIAKCSNDAA
jgi:protein gp37